MTWFTLACHSIGFHIILIFSLWIFRFGWQQQKKRTLSHVDDSNRNPHRKWFEGSSSASLRFNNEGYFKCDFKGLMTEITTHFENDSLNFTSNWPEYKNTKNIIIIVLVVVVVIIIRTLEFIFKNYPPTIKCIDASECKMSMRSHPFLDLLEFQQRFKEKTTNCICIIIDNKCSLHWEWLFEYAIKLLNARGPTDIEKKRSPCFECLLYLNGIVAYRMANT